jgi:hypothetical protein
MSFMVQTATAIILAITSVPILLVDQILILPLSMTSMVAMESIANGLEK